MTMDTVALITGAAGDIGRAVARRLAERGLRLILTDLSASSLSDVEAGLKDTGADVLARAVDVTDEDAVASLVREAREFGPITSVFNNAGIPGASFPIAEHPLDDVRKTFDVNFFGLFHVMKHALPHLAEHDDAWLLNVSSEAGLKANERRGAYSASKAAAIQITRAAALEYGRHGVRVNVLCPGPIEGDLMRRSEGSMPDPQELRDRLIASSAVLRYGEPDEVANYASYLLTEAPGYLTGATLTIDGCRR
ncbi:SDR family oxidoreductase [Phytoactinopolyspora alkaliphila]|uniref:SDR family oxidoreductase n=1 Tax=Phytoactinopolyspora alkaliphila TaxID=1783498 RepID=A0A6N9YK70_9ACTN|nr:SDR family oxidoreductase [Phytoactinopolyspora alkaliphila]NED95364.1 SDR family oxidoreductase [Phytoactinopolyspora alkaliphila]